MDSDTWKKLSIYLVESERIKWIVEKGLKVLPYQFTTPNIYLLSSRKAEIKTITKLDIPKLNVYLFSNLQLDSKIPEGKLEERLFSSEIGDFRVLNSTLIIYSNGKLLSYRFENGEEFVKITKSIENKSINEDGYVYVSDFVQKRVSSKIGNKLLFRHYINFNKE